MNNLLFLIIKDIKNKNINDKYAQGNKNGINVNHQSSFGSINWAAHEIINPRTFKKTIGRNNFFKLSIFYGIGRAIRYNSSTKNTCRQWLISGSLLSTLHSVCRHSILARFINTSIPDAKILYIFIVRCFKYIVCLFREKNNYSKIYLKK